MKKVFFTILLSIILVSCNSSKDVTYLQGSDLQALINSNEYISKIKPGDNLSIIVNSKIPELTQPFNMQLLNSPYIGDGLINTYNTGRPPLFEVYPDGCINYPIFGRIKVEGLSRYQLQDTIASLIISNELIKEPTVIVNFKERKYTVIGEVNRPGMYTYTQDRLTLFEALSTAGDLTIMGDRHRVKVVRETGGSISTTQVDITDKNILTDSSLFIEPNDVIYIEPIKSQANNRFISTLHNFTLQLVQTGVTIGRFIQRSK